MTTNRATNPTGALTPPHDTDAEQALLGAALVHPSAADTLIRETDPGDFYQPAHRLIAQAVTDLTQQSTPVTAITVADALAHLDRPDSKLQHRLTSLLANAAAPSAAPAYAQIVHDKATLRRTIAAADKASKLAYQPGADAHQVVLDAQEALSGVASQNGDRRYSSLETTEFTTEISTELEEPVMLTRTDGQSLLYAGKMHALVAEPSAGKSWIALAACAELVQWGQRFVYLDYEDSYRGIKTRLAALGVDQWAGSVYAQIEGQLGPAEQHDIGLLVERVDPALVVIDGVAEAMSRDGYDENSNADIARWMDLLPRPIARSGPAVLMLDHVMKTADPKDRKRGGRGGGHKLAGLDGVSYYVQLEESFAREKAGRVLMKIDKDRPAAVGPVGSTAAEVRLIPSDHGRQFKVELVAPASATSGVDDSISAVMVAVSRVLEVEDRRRASLHALCAPRSKAEVDRALELLVSKHWVTQRKQGSSILYRSVTAYNPEDAEPDPEPDPQPPLHEDF